MDSKLHVFNYKSNRDKLFTNLISIIDGILADGVLKDEEILYLSTWLLEAEQIKGNGVVRGLSLRVSDALVDGIISEKERIDLKKHLHKIQSDILDIPDIDFYSEEADINLLSGLCKGLISDRKLNLDEIKYLEWWLSSNAVLKNNYPGRELYILVKDILNDGIITEDESSALHKAIVSFTGCDLDSGIVDGLATRLPIDGDSGVTLKGKHFCLTGEFIAGKRSAIQSMLEKEGAEISPRITKKLDFLVIGTLSSRDWKFSSHGRKIEQAVSYRDELGTGIKIISEEMLFSALPRA